MPTRVFFQKLDPRAVEPTHMTTGSVGYDLTAIERVSFGEGELRVIRTGIALDIPPGHEGQIRLRSSLAKQGFWIPNAPGTIDWDYRGEILILLRYSLPIGDVVLSWDSRVIKAGERVAQLIIAETTSVEFRELKVLSPTERGEGGLGSTGKGTDTCPS